MKEEKYMFQYATKNKVIEDTGLITLEEAKKLWDKYQNDIKEKWDNYESPQMCIWEGCETNTNYHSVFKEIDFRDCELEDGVFYKIKKEIII